MATGLSRTVHHVYCDESHVVVPAHGYRVQGGIWVSEPGMRTVRAGWRLPSSSHDFGSGIVCIGGPYPHDGAVGLMSAPVVMLLPVLSAACGSGHGENGVRRPVSISAQSESCRWVLEQRPSDAKERLCILPSHRDPSHLSAVLPISLHDGET
jgi:hypothetical protein